MKSKIVLALAAASVLTLGASAQDFRVAVRNGNGGFRAGFGYAPSPVYSEGFRAGNRFDDRVFFDRGFNAGYRAGLEHRGFSGDFSRGLHPDERRAFDRGYREGLEKARIERESSFRHRW